MSASTPPNGLAASAPWLARRGGLLLLAIGAAYAALVATHRGEFWPFSVYPMFSRAGRPWARACVLQWTSGVDPALASGARPLEDWPGSPFPLEPQGLSQNDLSSLVQRAERWTASDVLAIESMFGSLSCEQPLVLMRVEGRLEGEVVRRMATPVAWLRCVESSTQLQPLLAPTSVGHGAP